jgi:hypothetical protein
VARIVTEIVPLKYDSAHENGSQRQAVRPRQVENVTPEELAAIHPRLYHTTDAANLEGILRHGLLSTSRILDLFGRSVAERDAFVRQRRRDRVRLEHPDGDVAVITDNSPLHEGNLARCLDDGLTPPDWCAKLNERVFFWVDEASLHRLLHAAASRDRDRLVLVFDTRLLAQVYAAQIELSPINSGSSVRKPARRGHTTFTPLLQHSYEAWRRLRRDTGEKITLDTIREVTVLDGIDNVEPFLEDRYLVPGQGM